MAQDQRAGAGPPTAWSARRPPRPSGSTSRRRNGRSPVPRAWSRGCAENRRESRGVRVAFPSGLRHQCDTLTMSSPMRLSHGPKGPYDLHCRADRTTDDPANSRRQPRPDRAARHLRPHQEEARRPPAHLHAGPVLQDRPKPGRDVERRARVRRLPGRREIPVLEVGSHPRLPDFRHTASSAAGCARRRRTTSTGSSKPSRPSSTPRSAIPRPT